jgi:hypothetical protein
MSKAPKTVQFNMPLKTPKGKKMPVYSRVGHYVEIPRGGGKPGAPSATPVKTETETKPQLAIGHTPAQGAIGHRPLLGLPAPRPRAIGYNPARPAAGPRALPGPTRPGLPGPRPVGPGTPRPALPAGGARPLPLSSQQGFPARPITARPAASGPRAVLGVSANATRAEIEKAYKSLSRRHHPDRPGGSTEKMAAINAAYSALGKGN